MDKPPSRAGMRLLWRLHRLIWDISGGRLGRRALGMPVLEMETTGWRSGRPRSILISFVATARGPVLAGTNAGSPTEPAWIKNLRADPEASAREGGAWRPVRARFLEGDEYANVWQLFLRHRGYGDYDRMTARRIPLVVLEDA